MKSRGLSVSRTAYKSPGQLDLDWNTLEEEINRWIEVCKEYKLGILESD